MTPERRKYIVGLGAYEAMLRGLIRDARVALKEYKHHMSVCKGDKWHTKIALRMTKHLIKTYKMGLPRRWPQGKLKPCPMCGNKAIYTVHSFVYDKCRGEYVTYCPECQCRTGSHASRKASVEAWNRRAE